MAKRLDDGRVQVNDGRIFDMFQVQMLIQSALLDDDADAAGGALDVASEILRDCPGPKGTAGLGTPNGCCAICGLTETHTHEAKLGN